MSIKRILTILEVTFLFASLFIFIIDMFVYDYLIHASEVFYFLFVTGLVNFINRIISDPNSITIVRRDKDK